MALIGRDTPIGFELPSISNQMSLDKWIRREEFQQKANPGFHASQNIHTDYEAAAKEGLSAPVAGGPLLAAHITRMMMLTFGEGWIQGGKISIKFIKPVYPDDFITAKGIVTEKIPEDSQMRLVCDVWVQRADGVKVVVGTASALIP